jgi:DNA replication protein DnaC
MQKLDEMRFIGFSRAYREMTEIGKNRDFTTDEVIAHLVQAEWDERYNRKLHRLLTQARFRYKASMEEIDYVFHRNLDKNTMLRLSTCDWITKRQNVIITGSTGLGNKVLYKNCIKLFDVLKIAKADGSYIKEMNKIEKLDLLILDDFGLKPLDNNQRLILLELLEDRHGKRSTIITSQLPVSKWYDIIGEPTISDAILDRLVHSSHRIELDGKESMRKKYKNN